MSYYKATVCPALTSQSQHSFPHPTFAVPSSFPYTSSLFHNRAKQTPGLCSLAIINQMLSPHSTSTVHVHCTSSLSVPF